MQRFHRLGVERIAHEAPYCLDFSARSYDEWVAWLLDDARERMTPAQAQARAAAYEAATRLPATVGGEGETIDARGMLALAARPRRDG